LLKNGLLLSNFLNLICIEGQFQGAAENKLFVASMNKQATAQEIHEVSLFIGVHILPLEELDVRIMF
jgi:hypothetical protein